MERKYSHVAVCALAGLAMTGARSQAQLEGCNSCDLDNDGSCSPTTYEAETSPKGKGNWESLVEGYSFLPDRRPGYVVTVGVGAYHATLNPYSVSLFWLDCNDNGQVTYPFGGSCYDYSIGGSGNSRNDSLDYLIEQMETALSLGFRRIMIDRPAGIPIGESVVPSSAWWTLPAWKRTALSANSNSLKTWIAYKKANGYADLEISVYLQYFIRDMPETNDDGDPCDMSMDPAIHPDYESAHEMEVVRQNFQPWIDVGVDTIWLDRATGPEWEPHGLGNPCSASYTSDSFVEYVLALQQSPDYLEEVKFGYETFALDVPSCPTSWDAQELVPDEYLARRGAYIQSNELFMCGQVFDPNDTWPAEWDDDAGDIEFNVWLLPPVCSDMNTRTLATMGAYREHGMYAWYAYQQTSVDGGYAAQLEQMKRVYDFGVVQCVADFNLDGTINSTDVGVFVNQWTRYENCGVTFYEGDIDDDDDVDDDDMDTFLDIWFNGVCTTKDLGKSEPLPPPCP